MGSRALFVALASSFLAAPCFAQEPQPLKHFQGLVDRLLTASDFPLKGSLVVVFEPTTRTDGPAGTYDQDNPANPNRGRPLLWISGRIFEFAKDDDECAFILAHELAHLGLAHYRRYRDVYCPAFDAWRAARGKPRLDCRGGNLPRVDTDDFWDHSPDQPRLEAVLAAHEDEADARGARLMRAAGFDPAGAERVLRRADDIHRSSSVEPDHHGQPLDRLAKVRKALEAPRFD